VTDSTFAAVGVWSYGVAFAGYGVFAIRVALGLRRGARARLLLFALVATTLWAALSLPLALMPMPGTALVAGGGDALRYGGWFAFLWHLLSRDAVGHPMARRSGMVFTVVAVLLIASVLFGEGSAAVRLTALQSPRLGILLHLGLAVFGLTLVEQLLRRVEPHLRWAIKPLALALAGTFGLDLLYFSDALLFGQFDADIWAARGFANVILIPFLAVATVRNTGWTIDLHLSRGAVFHSSALLVSGAFLLLVAGAGYFVRYLGGSWGRALQIELMFAAALVVALVATSGRFRARLKVFISKHFFSYRYDYREEWLRFTRTLSDDSAMQNIQERTITALADLVESPGGALWLKDESRGYVPAARWNMPPVDDAQRCDDELAAFLARTGWIISIPELRVNPAQYAGLSLPGWCESLTSPWLIVPLMTGGDLLGFVVLAAPRTMIDVDWEVRDLLKTASRQAASYVGQVMAAEALLEARKFEAFNRMSAFVVHDLKNLVAQLSLMLKNAQRHHNNPAFQSDMLETVQHVVARMNALMLQLRSGEQPVENPRPVNIGAIVNAVCAAKADPRVPIEIVPSPPAMAIGHEQRLEQVIAHLVQNAIDASPAGSPVRVAVELADRFVAIVIADTGAGMTREFIRDRLFKPFATTKPSGMGIGVYESMQYVSTVGGEIQVDSAPGTGTRVRVLLRAHEDPFHRAGDEQAARVPAT
jgi:putative PEP-CTERM system histidine kinase